MFGIINKKVAISNFKLARPRQLPTCPNGHGVLVLAGASHVCLECDHTQHRTTTHRTATTPATDLAHHLRQADAPEETQNEKRTIGPAGDSGGRGRAIPGGENRPSTDKIDQWVRESIEAEREAYRNRNWY